MDDTETKELTRTYIAVRFLYTIAYLIIFEILKTVVQISVLFQYIYLFIARDYSNPLRSFSNKVSVYAYRLLRYITLNENTRPFPLGDFPDEMDPPTPKVHFE